MVHSVYRVAQKWHHFCTPQLYQTLTDFLKIISLSELRIKKKICNKTNTKNPTTPHVCHYLATL